VLRDSLTPILAILADAHVPLHLVAALIASWLDDSAACTLANISRAVIAGRQALLTAYDIPASD
jgi:hypothetical protein